MTSLYRILGVSRHDGDTQIKSAYRRLVKQLHPDLHPRDTDVAERFKDVSRAYAILSDPTKRGRYDRGEIDGNGAQQRTFGQATKKTNIHRNRNGFEPFQQGQKSAPDVFQRFFSRSDEKSAFSAARSDHDYEITISFFEAARGISRRLSLRNGKSIDLIVPPGTSTGRALRLRGQGEPAVASTRAGDAIVSVSVTPHAFFTKQGNDVHIDLAVSEDDARLDGNIRVPTLDGAVTMILPRQAKAGTILRLKGKGIEESRKRGRGDQYVCIKILEADANAGLDGAITS